MHCSNSDTTVAIALAFASNPGIILNQRHLLQSINFLLTDFDWSLPHVPNKSHVFLRVVSYVLLAYVEYVELRCKACAQLLEKACHEVRAQATQQVSNETRATVLEKVCQELTLPWKQEKK